MCTPVFVTGQRTRRSTSFILTLTILPSKSSFVARFFAPKWLNPQIFEPHDIAVTAKTDVTGLAGGSGVGSARRSLLLAGLARLAG